MDDSNDLPPEQDDDPTTGLDPVVDDAGNLPDPKPSRRKPHIRPEPRAPLAELIQLRQERFPGIMKRDFATKFLGVTPLHMYYIESGRRPPSLELALRWIEVLGPTAKMSMFGPMPLLEERIRAIKRLQKIAPEVYRAA